MKAGKQKYFSKMHTFRPKKKITKTDVIVDKFESSIIQINFYSGTELLISTGYENEEI